MVSFLFLSTLIKAVYYLCYRSPVASCTFVLCLFSHFLRLLLAHTVSKLPLTFQPSLTSQPLRSMVTLALILFVFFIAYPDQPLTHADTPLL